STASPCPPTAWSGRCRPACGSGCAGPGPCSTGRASCCSTSRSRTSTLPARKGPAPSSPSTSQSPPAGSPSSPTPLRWRSTVSPGASNWIPDWAAEALAVFAKEWRCELRTQVALNTLGLFAVTTLVVASVSLGPLGVSKAQGSALLPVLLWLILLFSVAAGLPRAFVQEEESQTATALRLSATPSALFCGKLLYSLTLVAALEALITPIYVTIM